MVTRDYSRKDCALLPVDEMSHILRVAFGHCSEEIDSQYYGPIVAARYHLQDTLVQSGVPRKKMVKLLRTYPLSPGLTDAEPD